MPCCVLRVYGKDLDAEVFLASSGLVAEAIHRRGDRRSARSKVNETSWFTVLVSDADGNRIQQQVEDAVAFLKHNPDLARLVGYPE